MNRDKALFLYMERVHPTFKTPYERFLDEPNNWLRKDRPLTPSELEYAQRALDDMRDLQTFNATQTRNAPVLADEEMGAGISSLSLSPQP